MTPRAGATARTSVRPDTGPPAAGGDPDRPPRRDVCLTPAATARVWVGTPGAHETLAVPGVALAPGDALVSVELATICGSDVHTVLGHRPATTPLILGHEYVGRIVETGDAPVLAVDGRALEPGERVVWSILASCDRCDRCRRGIPEKCRELRKYGHERIVPRWELSGGFGSHMHLRAGTAIVRVGDKLPAETLAPLSCGTATAWAALDRADRIAGLDDATVLITGAGLIGLTATAMAADRGCAVIVSDPDPARRARAVRFGAAAVVDPAEGSAAVRAALAQLRVEEITVAVEASGASAAVAGILDVVGVGAAVILVGSVFASPPVMIDPERIVRNHLTIRGVHNYTPADLAAASDYLASRAASRPFADLVGAVLPLERLDEAIQLAAEGHHVRVGVRAGR